MAEIQYVPAWRLDLPVEPLPDAAALAAVDRTGIRWVTLIGVAEPLPCTVLAGEAVRMVDGAEPILARTLPVLDWWPIWSVDLAGSIADCGRQLGELGGVEQCLDRHALDSDDELGEGLAGESSAENLGFVRPEKLMPVPRFVGGAEQLDRRLDGLPHVEGETEHFTLIVGVDGEAAVIHLGDVRRVAGRECSEHDEPLVDDAAGKVAEEGSLSSRASGRSFEP